MLLFEAVLDSCQKLNREIKQARLVNIVLDAVKKRTHELDKLLHLNAFFWFQMQIKRFVIGVLCILLIVELEPQADTRSNRM